MRFERHILTLMGLTLLVGLASMAAQLFGLLFAGFPLYNVEFSSVILLTLLNCGLLAIALACRAVRRRGVLVVFMAIGVWAAHIAFAANVVELLRFALELDARLSILVAVLMQSRVILPYSILDTVLLISVPLALVAGQWAVLELVPVSARAGQRMGYMLRHAGLLTLGILWLKPLYGDAIDAAMAARGVWGGSGRVLMVLGLLLLTLTLLVLLQAMWERIRPGGEPGALPAKSWVLHTSCPRCESRVRLDDRPTACPSCGTWLHLAVREPRCLCGYSLINLKKKRCPECGRETVSARAVAQSPGEEPGSSDG